MSGGDVPSDTIEFGTDGWRASGEAFTLDRVRAIGQAVCRFLDEHEKTGPVAVGYDARPTSREAAEQLARIVAANGRTVTMSQRDCPTPVLAWTVADGPYVGGLMVTASHNPPEYNGVKYIMGDGTPALPSVTDALETLLGEPEAVAKDVYGTISEERLSAAYLEHARSFVESAVDLTGLDGMSIGYDAMHGSGRGVTDDLLETAGADLTRLRCERAERFGGISPEPRPDNAGELVKLVQNGAVTLGFINDGDADRLGVITPARGFLDPNVLLTIIYQFLLEHSPEDSDVVRTVSTSSLVDRVASDAGQATHETPVGFKWVAQAMADHDALAGGEESGGYGIGNHLYNKDGVLLALLLATAHDEHPLDVRIDALFDRHGQITQDRTSVRCPDEQKATVLDALDGAVPDRIADRDVTEVSTVDGFKLHLDDGSWLLVRPSGTEPKLRIYAEATNEQRVAQLLTAGTELVSAHVE